MAEGVELKGQCMCGAVTFIATAQNRAVSVCHCDMCRRWSSGPFMGVNCQKVMFEGEEHISRMRSSEWAERRFCAKCGSNLFYHIVEGADYQMSAGLINDQTMLEMSLQVFTDSKPPFYEFANETKMMTAAEVYAAFASPSD